MTDMRLADLLTELDVLEVRGDPGTSLTAVVHDSRRVGPDSLFCCVAGRLRDGHDHAPEALERGAAALLVERFVGLDVPQVLVPAVRPAMARAAAAMYGHPSRSLKVVGITGTNGKTTTAHFVQSMLEAHGWPTALIGTLTASGTGPPNTPDSPELQERLARHRDRGGAAVAMEVSSHALVQHRVDAVRFAVAVFTNLSRDHLDYHGTMEDYFAAKAQLFDPERSERAVVNLDDPRGRLLRDAARIPTRGFALGDAEDVTVGLRESTFGWRGVDVRVPIGGEFNVANALAALTAVGELGLAPDAAAAGLAQAGPVPGRLEAIDAGQPFTALVDYAHTPDGLEHLLRTVRAANPTGRVLLVFGCGGDKDRGKRPDMGRVAARGADVVVVTSDNPRSEDPLAIIDEVTAGFHGTGGTAEAEVEVEVDRRRAIAVALGSARDGDVVVVAGKGHETVQIVANREIPFDDRRVVAEELAVLAEERSW